MAVLNSLHVENVLTSPKLLTVKCRLFCSFQFTVMFSAVFQFPEFDDIYCKCCYKFGPDWLVTSVSTNFATLVCQMLKSW